MRHLRTLSKLSWTATHSLNDLHNPRSLLQLQMEDGMPGYAS